MCDSYGNSIHQPGPQKPYKLINNRFNHCWPEVPGFSAVQSQPAIARLMPLYGDLHPLKQAAQSRQ